VKEETTKRAQALSLEEKQARLRDENLRRKAKGRGKDKTAKGAPGLPVGHRPEPLGSSDRDPQGGYENCEDAQQNQDNGQWKPDPSADSLCQFPEQRHDEQGGSEPDEGLKGAKEPPHSPDHTTHESDGGLSAKGKGGASNRTTERASELPIENQPEDFCGIVNPQSSIGDSPANPEPRMPEPGAAKAEVRAPSPEVEVVEPQLVNSTKLRSYQNRWSCDPSRFAIAVKAAQIGFSTATAAWAVSRCLLIPLRNIIFLSRSERQSRELAEKAKQWLQGYEGAVAEYAPDGYFEGTSMLQHEIRFPNGSRIIVLAANPDTARGYTGDVVLDEFAFHQDSQSIFTAVYRQVSLGYSMRILSTPNGPQGKFYELAKSLSFDTGVRPTSQPVKTKAWSGHWVNIHLAVEEGCPLDVEMVQAGCDQQTWLQEYCCQFVSEGSTWIPPELYQQCVSSEAGTEFAGAGIDSLNHWSIDPLKSKGNESMNQWRNEPILYAGWDIARNHDLSVIWLTELLGDVTWTRGVVEMRNMPTPDQIREARSLMPFVRRMEIDKGGMGLAIYEALARDFPGQVEGIQFTAAKKETMAVLAKRRMEEGKVRLPDREQIRQSFRAVRKSVNCLGQARFDAEHDIRFGHADHWWAFCLAEAAAEQPVYHLRHVGAVIGNPVIAGLRSTGLIPSEAGSAVPGRMLEFPT